MRQITAKIKPKSGFANILHYLLLSLLPITIFVLVRLRFFQLAAALIVVSKWRMFAVKPRHWPANLRANAVDIIVGIAFLVFMIQSASQAGQLFWAFGYIGWLTWLKPKSSDLGVSVQALAAQVLGMIAVYLVWGSAPIIVLMLASWAVSYSAARHFFANFEESYIRFLAYSWGFFSLALSWLTGHWLIFYGSVSQPALLLAVLSFGLGSLYYLDKTDRLSPMLRRQLLVLMTGVVLIIITFSEWGDRTI